MKSLTEIMKTFDVKDQDDHRAKIAEREYWRKLRGDIFLEMYRDYLAKGNFIKTEDDLLDKTKFIVDRLWQQDGKFCNDNNCSESI